MRFNNKFMRVLLCYIVIFNNYLVLHIISVFIVFRSKLKTKKWQRMREIKIQDDGKFIMYVYILWNYCLIMVIYYCITQGQNERYKV